MTLPGGHQRTGKVLELANVVNALKRLVTAVKDTQRTEGGGQKSEGSSRSGLFEWKHNALRHSFCSYRLADVKSAAEVALEAGNSPQMIFQHYRELVTERAAKGWFAITPEVAKAVRERIEEERKAKIVAFPARAA
jgi:hypothetical protein